MYSSLLICNRAVTNKHVVEIPPMLVNLDRVFPFFPSRLQLGWCFFNFSSCDFFLSKGYLVPCLKCNNDSHRIAVTIWMVFFQKKTIAAINMTVFSPKVPRLLLISPCAQISSTKQEYLRVPLRNRRFLLDLGTSQKSAISCNSISY